MIASAQPILILLATAFAVTALVYASAGFAGGSTYLALLALCGFPLTLMPTTALVCNIIVALGGTIAFARAGHFSARTVMPFLIASMPMAYLGGRVPVGKTAFLVLLGISLFIAALKLCVPDNLAAASRAVSQKKAWLIGPPIGAFLGFWSGITGIGGGIFLAPTLYFLGWAKPKTIAASASCFILFNSLSGLVGQLQKNAFHIDVATLVPLATAVLVGGQIGSRLGSEQFAPLTVRRVTAALIFIVAINVLWSVSGGKS